MKFVVKYYIVGTLVIITSGWICACSQQNKTEDWSESLMNYVIEMYMPAEKYVWNWNEAVFLKAMVNRCEHCHSSAGECLTYIKKAVNSTWADINGHHPNAVISGVALAYLASLTCDSNYWNEALKIYEQYTHIPRATNGGVSHRMEVVELWDDTVYMVGEFLLQMYKLTKDEKYLSEAILQLKKHAEKLEDIDTGLWYHGWDNDTIPSNDPCSTPGWAENPERRSSEFWGRGNGWITMMLSDLLEYTPQNHPYYIYLRNSFQKMMETLCLLQDGNTGHWYQLPVYPRETGNYLESSCTAMFAYSMAKGIRLGLLSAEHYMPIVDKAYKGLERFSLQPIDGGYMKMKNICTGTCIGDKAYYYNREVVEEQAYAFGLFIMFADEYKLVVGHK
ncbi:glycoside hydrolase family 88 protein [Mediterranea massiliensis]|uniref:glycoside hydrolase family 88/105 protein n=1 Tax=Mediterranea massiliensis TaxID=1841865 RepID=UPI00320AE70C